MNKNPKASRSCTALIMALLLSANILAAGCSSGKPPATRSAMAQRQRAPRIVTDMRLARPGDLFLSGSLFIPCELYRKGTLERVTWNEIDAMVTHAARCYGLKKEALYALMKARTNQNLRYHSPNGALGIMGLPPVAVRTLDIEHPANHAANIIGSAAYFHRLIDAYNNDTRAALIAYNGGAESLTRAAGAKPASVDDCFVSVFSRYMTVYESGIPPWEHDKVTAALGSLFPAAHGPRHTASASQATGRSPVPTKSDRMHHNELDGIVRHYARAHGVDAALVLAVIEVESRFRVRAVSPKGAKGLMQLMPATARMLGVNDPFDPQQNIAGGTLYLAQLNQQFKGDIRLVLAAYNAGPGNVRRYGGIPPFRETQQYVANVLSARERFR